MAVRVEAVEKLAGRPTATEPRTAEYSDDSAKRLFGTTRASVAGEPGPHVDSCRPPPHSFHSTAPTGAESLALLTLADPRGQATADQLHGSGPVRLDPAERHNRHPQREPFRSAISSTAGEHSFTKTYFKIFNVA